MGTVATEILLALSNALMKNKSLLAANLACLAFTAVAHGTEGYFDSNGVKIRYVTEGEGEACSAYAPPLQDRRRAPLQRIPLTMNSHYRLS